MNPSPKNLPRFLPTLTEVVQPDGLLLPDRAPMHETGAPRNCAEAQIDNALLEHRLRSEAERLLEAELEEQTRYFSTRLRQELEPIVQGAVADAMAAWAARGDKRT